MSGEPATVTRLATTAVKGMRLRHVEQINLKRSGVRENRRFYVIDDRGRMINGKQLGELHTILADYSEHARRLTLTFADGEVVDGAVKPGPPFPTRFFSRMRDARLLSGPWSAALSAHTGQALRLVEAPDGAAVDRGRGGAASLISRGSLRRLAEAAGAPDIDPRRFRMLIEIDGVSAHEEDDWVGRRVRVGAALVAFNGHVGRCLVTSRDPETGAIDLPTLEILKDYRNGLQSTEPLAFGIFGEVLEEGLISLGDPVLPEAG